MPLRTQAVCDRCGVEETFGESQSFPETPPPDWYGLKLTTRKNESYAFCWGLLCGGCYGDLTSWLHDFKPFSDVHGTNRLAVPTPAPASEPPGYNGPPTPPPTDSAAPDAPPEASSSGP